MQVGDVFNTPFEAGCVVTDVRDLEDFGVFLALDSDGVECQFSLEMVVNPENKETI